MTQPKKPRCKVCGDVLPHVTLLMACRPCQKAMQKAAEPRDALRDLIADLEKQNAMLRKGMDMVNEQLIEAVEIIRRSSVRGSTNNYRREAFLSRNSHLIRNPFEDGSAEDQGADLDGPNSSPNEERS